MITLDAVKSALHYNPATGVFTWLRRVNAHVAAGARAGTISKQHGYRIIRLQRRPLRASRLAWFYVTGEWPTGIIDHRDTDRLNDRFDNLRDVTHRVNLQNQRRAHVDSQSGLLGAFRRRDRWISQIQTDGKTLYLGTFDTAEAAHAAYVAAKRTQHQGCTL